MSVAFHDENGVRWTVVPHSAPQAEAAGRTTLVFTSERGERRTCEGCLPEGGTWDDVDERVWRALLRYSEVMPATPDGP
jgi:hypothetical protein